MGMGHRVPCKPIGCPYTHPRLLGWDQKVRSFVMLYIKLKGMEHRSPCKHIFCPYIHLFAPMWGRKV